MPAEAALIVVVTARRGRGRAPTAHIAVMAVIAVEVIVAVVVTVGAMVTVAGSSPL
jgi:hypothetical protein